MIAAIYGVKEKANRMK